VRIPGLLLLVLLTVLLSGCGGSSTPAGAARTAAATPDAGAASPGGTQVPDIVLPAGALRGLVPATPDLPPGLVPILAGSGPRDAHAIAAYSADPKAAGTLLIRHGFREAYVGQYADPATGRVLSVVASRFATAAGAGADLGADLAASSGELIPAATVGDQSQVRRQPLPGGKGELITVRFRKAATTGLVAYGASPTADPAVAVDLAKRLAARG
jgi:hypothetical protein